MPKPVLTKRDFVRRYAAGEFGNASPTWDSVVEWCSDEPWERFGSLYHIRNRIAGAATWYNVDYRRLEWVWQEALAKFLSGQLYISAMAPTEKTVLQGEVQRGLWGLDLYYTTVAKPMREALRVASYSVRGIIAVSLLRQHLCPNSYDWLMHLLDSYPGHVVEFSTYSVEWGTVPGYNTVFWEVRKY